jgi:hypothetical protein
MKQQYVRLRIRKAVAQQIVSDCTLLSSVPLSSVPKVFQSAAQSNREAVAKTFDFAAVSGRYNLGGGTASAWREDVGMTGKTAIRQFALLHIKQLPSGTNLATMWSSRSARASGTSS